MQTTKTEYNTNQKSNKAIIWGMLGLATGLAIGLLTRGKKATTIAKKNADKATKAAENVTTKNAQETAKKTNKKTRLIHIYKKDN